MKPREKKIIESTMWLNSFKWNSMSKNRFLMTSIRLLLTHNTIYFSNTAQFSSFGTDFRLHYKILLSFSRKSARKIFSFVLYLIIFSTSYSLTHLLNFTIVLGFSIRLRQTVSSLPYFSKFYLFSLTKTAVVIVVVALDNFF